MSGLAKVPAVFVAYAQKGLLSALQRLLPNTTFVNLEVNQKGELSSDDREKLLEEAEVLISSGSIIGDVVYDAKKLRWAHCTWAGVEGIVKAGKHPGNVEITRTGRAYTTAMAEYVVGNILNKERFIVEQYKEQEKANWAPSRFKDYRTLKEVTVCVLGVGEIGKGAAELCKAVGMTVYGVNRSIPSEEKKCPAVDGYRTISDLPQVLPECDYLCNVLPSTPQTTDLLSGTILSHCQQKKTVFINIGRASVIDEDSLITAIRSGWLGGAVLDVFHEEPLSSSSPLWTLPGVIITPHTAGIAPAGPVAEAFVSNYKLFCENKEMDFRVDWKSGY